MNIEELVIEVIRLFVEGELSLQKVLDLLLDFNYFYIFLPIIVTLIALIIEMFFIFQTAQQEGCKYF